MMDLFLFKLRILIFRSTESNKRCTDGESDNLLNVNQTLINLFSLSNYKMLNYLNANCIQTIIVNVCFVVEDLTKPLGLRVMVCLFNF